MPLDELLLLMWWWWWFDVGVEKFDFMAGVALRLVEGVECLEASVMRTGRKGRGWSRFSGIGVGLL